jgi:hypothetical protein
MNSRFVLKNRKRFYTFIMILTVILTVTVFATAANGADSHSGFETVTVEREIHCGIWQKSTPMVQIYMYT